MFETWARLYTVIDNKKCGAPHQFAVVLISNGNQFTALKFPRKRVGKKVTRKQSSALSL